MPGIFTLSLDTEIAWGTDDHNLSTYAPCFESYPVILRRLISLLDHYHIPVTWAIVGQLLLAEGTSDADSRQPTHWYHAPYVLDWIVNARTTHEIGTHTYRHIYARHEEVTRAIWEADLAQVAALHQRLGLPLRSIVFPRNQIAYLDSLHQHGIITYRGIEGNRPQERRGWRHLLQRSLPLPPPTYPLSSLRTSDSLVNLPASQFLLDYQGVRRWLPTASRVREAEMGLRRAAQDEHLYHLWFHPFNLGTHPHMFDALEAILQRVAAYRERGTLQVMTMQQAAEQLRSTT
jgi:peptidoglycan/xylan/chitin deacetylase (PgdA/CDA1 family)